MEADMGDDLAQLASQEILDWRSLKQYAQHRQDARAHVARISVCDDLIRQDPYCIPLHLYLAVQYLSLDYPDLASGAAYKALLLSDALHDEAEEYHEQANESLQQYVESQSAADRQQVLGDVKNAQQDTTQVNEDSETHGWMSSLFTPLIYELLIESLLLCGCYRSAYTYISQALRLYPSSEKFVTQREGLITEIQQRLGLERDAVLSVSAEWPDHGLVRREQYPWNRYEPDRLLELERINDMMQEVSSVLEVRAVELPVLSGDKSDTAYQLGVFAKADILPGQVVLEETSFLTANNRLQDTLCDACSSDLPELSSAQEDSTVSCPDCEVVFCSETCYEKAMTLYHPALCEKDVEAIAKDVPPAEAADSLYSLLLLRALAMAETQECHPLQLREVMYIWGDFTNVRAGADLRQSLSSDERLPYCDRQRALPFSFEHNIRLPFHMLEKMDVDIFQETRYDVWVFNTLFAKFRGTASARLSGRGGRAIRGPEVSAVHPMWCLANHSCEPNVRWEWGGEIRLWARDEPIVGRRSDGATRISELGIKRDAEILNHYCDVELSVKDRREWARGALGGDCQCARCIWETEVDV